MRKRFTPATVLAMVALFVALAGSATAAGTVLISGKQIKDGSIGLADLSPAAKRSLRSQAGPVGPAGVQGPAGAQGAQGPAGAQGAAGERGPAGAQGPAGERGSAGAQGAPGADFSSVEDLRGKPCKLPGGTSGVFAPVTWEEEQAGYAPPTPPSANPQSLIGSGARSLTLYCLTTDRWENNDDRAAAADISTSRAGGGGLWQAAGTMLPTGDDDWYELPATKLAVQFPRDGGPKITVGYGDQATVRMDVYRDGVQVASNSTGYALTASDTDTLHDWEIRVFGSTVEPYAIYIH